LNCYTVTSHDGILTFSDGVLKLIIGMKKKTTNQINIQTPDRNAFKDFQILSHQIMRLALYGFLRIDFLNKAAKILMEFSGCDSVQMWLKERGKYYCSEVTRSKKRPFHLEIIPIMESDEGRIIPKLGKNLYLEQLCRDIILRQFDPSLPFFTKNGSFWTGDAENSSALLSKQKRKTSAREPIVEEDYRSLALIPISVENENIGLLQLKSTSPDFFKKKDVEFYEGVVQTLAVALIHRRAQVELRERVKELTCLYGIAKLVERPSISLKEILQGIVELLPPAWLYPEIASARIILDEYSYTTSGFLESAQKQAANIVVDGEERGIVEVVYSKKKPELDEGPFLKEERNLIDTVAREITLIIERKQTEQDKERLQEQLRHADRLATIGQLSAGVAHELNEPIGSILGFAQLIQKYPKLSEQAKQDIEKIMKASLHAREVIKKLMLFARQLPPQRTQVNLNQIVEESLYFLESRCAKEGIKVVRLLSSELPKVTADPAQMTQILVNIAVNAIQAMPNGGRLMIQTKASDKFVSLTIEDTGIGMTENVMKQIFLPFFSTKDIGKGTGLGLPVVHGIVTSHGGSVNVDSKVGKGTRFKIQLPIADPKGEEEEA
jgi:two-component system NtrC family sensor kinase